MPLISPSLPGPVSTALPVAVSTALCQTIDLNIICREVMKKHNDIRQKLKLVMRCEALPVVAGDTNIITPVFDALICSIITGFTPQGLFFLYIDYEENTVTEQKDKLYRIKFNANIKLRTQWLEKNSAVLRNCEQLLSAQGGGLTVNDNGLSPCLFSIILPSKFG